MVAVFTERWLPGGQPGEPGNVHSAPNATPENPENGTLSKYGKQSARSISGGRGVVGSASPVASPSTIETRDRSTSAVGFGELCGRVRTSER